MTTAWWTQPHVLCRQIPHQYAGTKKETRRSFGTRAFRTILLLSILLTGSALTIRLLPTYAISTCGSTITTSTVLTGDILLCPGNGLVIGASNLTLDCRAHTISGTWNGKPPTPSTISYGIITLGPGGINLSGITVKNCLVKGFGIAYEINHVTGSTFQNNTASSNFRGFNLNVSSTNTITSNTAYGNTNLDFYSQRDSLATGPTDNNVFTNNKSTNTIRNDTNPHAGYGILGSNETISNNVAYFSGFHLSLNSSRVSYNTAINASTAFSIGSSLTGLSNKNGFSYNNAFNSSYGFVLTSGNFNNFTSNLASVGAVGFFLLGSSNNNLTLNAANSLNSVGYDVETALSLGNNNVFLSNTAQNDYVGFGTFNANGTVIAGNTITNGNLGMNVTVSANNRIYNNQIFNNNIGIEVVNSTGIVINSNRINNRLLGINLTFSSSNLIYNNYFTNGINAVDKSNNQWNISKTAGTNIILGSFLGGNFWSDYTGSDPDNDGLGDNLIPYNSSGRILHGGDFLPLVLPQGSLGGGRPLMV